MATEGTIYIVPNPRQQQWELVVHNEGNTVFGVTNNILPENDKDQRSHDDTRFGHGLVVNPGGVSHQAFPRGEKYTHDGSSREHTIDEDCYIRVGLRDLAYQTVRLPPMNGKPVEVDVARGMEWYGGRPTEARPYVDDMEDFVRDAKFALHHDVADGDEILAKIRRLLNKKVKGPKLNPKGYATIEAVKRGGKLVGWDVRFVNTGDQAFTGTAVFAKAEKSSGRGLESMAVPDKGSAAEQRIIAHGDYGIRPRPGTVLRLGVRGHSYAEIKLPAAGKRRVNIRQFKKARSQVSPDYFVKTRVRNKRREKIGRISFFQDGRELKLREMVFTGQEARSRASFNPPEVSVRRQQQYVYGPDGEERLENGWRVDVESTLPERDQRGEPLFIARVEARGQRHDDLVDPVVLVPGDYQSMFIPDSAVYGGKRLRSGDFITIDTGALGWRGQAKLPRNGAVRATAWEFREHSFSRWEMEEQSRRLESWLAENRFKRPELDLDSF